MLLLLLLLLCFCAEEGGFFSGGRGEGGVGWGDGVTVESYRGFLYVRGTRGSNKVLLLLFLLLLFVFAFVLLLTKKAFPVLQWSMYAKGMRRNNKTAVVVAVFCCC